VINQTRDLFGLELIINTPHFCREGYVFSLMKNSLPFKYVKIIKLRKVLSQDWA
jgi:hypothetical protein